MTRGLTPTALSLVAFFCIGCERTDCNRQEMLDMINNDIRSDGRQPIEYTLAEVKQLSNGVYVGMSQNHSPTYRRHYLIDPAACKIVEAQFDQ